MFFWITVVAGLILLGGVALFVGFRNRTRRTPDGVVDSSRYIRERRRAKHGDSRRATGLHTGSDREA